MPDTQDIQIVLTRSEIEVALQALPQGRPFQYGTVTPEFEATVEAFDSLTQKLTAALAAA